MKVIHIMDNLSTAGGVNSFVFDLCYALKKQGVDVSLIGILNREESTEVQKLRDSGIIVKCVGSDSKKNALLHDIPKLTAMVKEISSGEKTICNLHLKLSVLMGCLATRGVKNVKCVETYHSLYSKYLLENKLMAPFIKKYIACSKSAADEMRKRFHTPDKKLTYISNGVCREVLRASASALEEKIDEEQVNIVSVGRFTEQKNFHVTTEAFSKLSGRYVYKLFGQGPLKEKAISASNGSKNIEFFGNVARQKVMQVLKNADIVVMPSLWEGLSIFMLEAMAFDNPMMISNEASLANVFYEKLLCDGETWRCCSWGYLVDTNNVQAYKEAMEHFMSHRDMWNEMKNCVRKISYEYDISTVAERYIQVYTQVF